MTPLAEQFAAALQRLHPNLPAAVSALARQTCAAVEQGRVCLRLSDEPLAAATSYPPVIGAPGDYAPLILDGTRLYLARYWHYETQVAQRLARWATQRPQVDLPQLRRDLDRLFGDAGGETDWQKAAAAAAVLRHFCVISGGPGTGKTSTVLRILVALQSQAGGELRIALAAPTGKAAARMQDAARAAKQRLGMSAPLPDGVPDHAQTLHRLLGARPESVYFRHDADNPLPLDVLVVDEASMIDLALLSKLLEALPDACRLILLGDKDQLSAVEAGAVFGDVCAAGGGYGAEFRRQLAELGFADVETALPATDAVGARPLDDAVHVLRRSYRFADDSGVGVLARLCNQGQAAEALALLAEGGNGLTWRQTGGAHALAELPARMVQGYADYFAAVEAGDAEAAFAAFERFRVLTAHGEGESGAEHLNRCVEAIVKVRLNLHYRTLWYPGRAVMIARNDYNLRLFNGDVGIALPRQGQLRVHFADGDGRVRDLAPGRLPECRPVYAMTVHKSQGSEFEHVLLALPDYPSPLLDRPLLYTAITRARRTVEIWASAAILQHAIGQTPSAASGLRERWRSPNRADSP